eukprot:scaffold26732_cov145-Skeletonema_menzelii.AAC.8
MTSMISDIDLQESRQTLNQIDANYECIGCLGHGGFGSVFAAKKKSGRRVALKVMPMDTSDEEEYEKFTREIEAVVKLNSCMDEERKMGNNRDLSIVYFEDWFIASSFVCIVMNYVDGGTLAMELERKTEPYAERRIGWYALQLCDALAFAHERGVSHHDVKAANILIDASGGGKLLLADFGTSLKPGEECVGFTKCYASPELLASFELEDFSSLRPDKIDSYALGCVLYELLLLQRLEHVSEQQTLAQFISDGAGLDAAMESLPLPFLPQDTTQSNVVGYTQELKNLVMNLLQPNASERWLPSQLQQPLRHDPKSPLLMPHLAAAKTASPGVPVTVDNIQLGMFVQRGLDWNDGDKDGPIGSVGVVVSLDADALYAEVAFPSRTSQMPPVPICCRIGASNKFELKVGPVPLPDFVSNPNDLRHDGIVPIDSTDDITLGGKLNGKCEVVGINKSLGVIMVAPLELLPIKSLARPQLWQLNESSFVSPREHSTHPSRWRLDQGAFTDLLEQEEFENVLSLFFGTIDLPDHLKKEYFPVKKIERAQDTWLFESYARRKEKVAMENWGLANEVDAFMTSDGLHQNNIQMFSSGGKEFSMKALHILGKIGPSSSTKQILLCRVVIGRAANASSPSNLICHSESIGDGLYRCRGPCLAYPQYIITYSNRAPRDFRYGVTTEVADVPQSSPEQRSPTKECVICMERPVKYVMVPCGHAVLCDRCNSPYQLRKLKSRCPECRATFQRTMMIYGRVVNDE